MPLSKNLGPGRYVALRSKSDQTVNRTRKSATSSTDSPSGLHLWSHGTDQCAHICVDVPLSESEGQLPYVQALNSNVNVVLSCMSRNASVQLPLRLCHTVAPVCKLHRGAEVSPSAAVMGCSCIVKRNDHLLLAWRRQMVCKAHTATPAFCKAKEFTCKP